MNRSVLSLLAGSLVAAAVAYGAARPTGTSEGEKAPLMVSFAELKWTALPERPGMQFTVLSGDPKTGPYTQLRRVPAGTDNPLHAHSSEITNVMISGTWYTGVDAASAKDFGPGSVVRMPTNWVHVSGCRAGSGARRRSRPARTGRGGRAAMPHRRGHPSSPRAGSRSGSAPSRRRRR